MYFKTPSFILTIKAFPILAGLVLLLIAGQIRATESAEKPPVATGETALRVPAKSVEDRDALLARLTKILNYGSDMSLAKPSKNDAVVALGLVGDERAVPVLAEHLANNENKFLRLRIVRALGWIGGQQVVPSLESALKDEYPPVRKQAADVLLQLTGRTYDYDKTGLEDVSGLSEADGSSLSAGKRLESIAVEVAKRRELRQVAAGGTATTEKKKMAEPVDIVMENLPVRLVAKTYTDVTGKLVLVSPKISLVGVTCKIEKAKLADAQAALEKALLDSGVLVVELERGVIAFTPVDSSRRFENTAKP